MYFIIPKFMFQSHLMFKHLTYHNQFSFRGTEIWPNQAVKLSKNSFLFQVYSKKKKKNPGAQLNTKSHTTQVCAGQEYTLCKKL